MSARILIVDDEEIVVRSCKRILEGPGIALDSADNGRDALRKADEAPPDIVILDIMMPGMDGMQVLQLLKERHPEVDVIMVTGLSQIRTAVQAMKLGAFDYLPKPFVRPPTSAPTCASTTSSAPARRCRPSTA